MESGTSDNDEGESGDAAMKPPNGTCYQTGVSRTMNIVLLTSAMFSTTCIDSGILFHLQETISRFQIFRKHWLEFISCDWYLE